MVWLAALMLLLGALMLVINHLLVERRRVRQVNQRLQGQLVRENRFGSWLRALGSSKFGQRSVSIDSETQTLLNRIGWRRANERALFAACQIGTPLLTLGLAIFLQEVFFPQASNRWIVPMLATGGGYLLPKRLLAYAATRRQKTIAVEVSTFIPLLRILTDRGTEFCGAREHHEYELYLALEDIDHTRTKARHPQTWAASASGCTAPCRTSSMQWLSARKSM